MHREMFMMTIEVNVQKTQRKESQSRDNIMYHHLRSNLHVARGVKMTQNWWKIDFYIASRPFAPPNRLTNRVATLGPPRPVLPYST
jgi:hypothetical protein